MVKFTFLIKKNLFYFWIVYDFLNSEFQKDPKLQEGKNIINKSLKTSHSENNKIYEFKLESINNIR